MEVRETRRALARARTAKSLDAREVTALLAARGAGSFKLVADLRSLARSVGRPAVQRTTTYGRVGPERLAAAERFDAAMSRRLPLTPTATSTTEVSCATA
jgi:hypothetical protein